MGYLTPTAPLGVAAVQAEPVAGDVAGNARVAAAIHDPEGRPVGRAADRGEAVVPGRLDPAELLRVRERMLLDRRPDQGVVRDLLTA